MTFTRNTFLLTSLLLAILASSLSAGTKTKHKEIFWEELVPDGYTVDSVYAKYQKQVDEAPEGSDEAFALYEKVMEELNNAPLNEKLKDSYIKLPGFIAPLDQDGESINEFLLVPYFGACVHSPPPPLNQTVYVKVSSKDGVSLEDSFLPIWIYGKLQTTGKKTEIGNAGYSIAEARIEPYLEDEMINP